MILFTSGTTGRPKGVQLSHFELFMNADAHRQGFEMTEADIMVAVAPMFHTLGLSGVLNSTVLAGGALRLMTRFDAGQMLDVIQQDKATIFHGVPTMYHALLQHPKLADYDTSSLRIAGSAGAALPAEFLDNFERKFGVVILELYGLTESGPVATFNRRDDRKPYSVGKPIWGVDMQVWDDEGRRLPPGRENIGEFVLRGHAITKGYYKNPEATAETITDGWLHTGDLGYQDEEGFYFIVDRKKDLVIRGGYNVYPREVEDVLYLHPAVGQVAVVGIPDERLGEEVRAFCVLKPDHSATEQELIAFTRERLAAYKYPRSVVFLNALPLGPTGKADDLDLAQQGRLTDRSEFAQRVFSGQEGGRGRRLRQPVSVQHRDATLVERLDERVGNGAPPQTMARTLLKSAESKDGKPAISCGTWSAPRTRSRPGTG